MPRLCKNDLLSSLSFGALTILVLALALAQASKYGAPSWLIGQELEIFVKLSFATIAVVAVDLCWKTRSPQVEGEVATAQS